jgi:hypothetical protein
MKNETTGVLPLETRALAAAFVLDNELLSDPGFAGYYGEEMFESLQAQVYAIAKTVESINGIVETFYQFQNEICEGDREVDWYLYV